MGRLLWPATPPRITMIHHRMRESTMHATDLPDLPDTDVVDYLPAHAPWAYPEDADLAAWSAMMAHGMPLPSDALPRAELLLDSLTPEQDEPWDMTFRRDTVWDVVDYEHGIDHPGS